MNFWLLISYIVICFIILILFMTGSSPSLRFLHRVFIHVQTPPPTTPSPPKTPPPKTPPPKTRLLTTRPPPPTTRPPPPTTRPPPPTTRLLTDPKFTLELQALDKEIQEVSELLKTAQQDLSSANGLLATVENDLSDSNFPRTKCITTDETYSIRSYNVPDNQTGCGCLVDRGNGDAGYDGADILRPDNFTEYSLCRNDNEKFKFEIAPL